MPREPRAPGAPRRGEAAPGVLYAGIGDEAARDLRDQVGAITALGWQLIELRSIDGIALADLDDAQFAACLATLDAAGLGTACVDSRIAGWARPITQGVEQDFVELDRLRERCAALGTRYIRIMSYPNDGWDEASWGAEVIRRVRLLATRAEDAGLILLHENCAGWAGDSARRMLRLVEEVDSPALRLLFDIGNGAAYHYQAYDILADILGQAPELVAHVHVKDAVGSGDSAGYVLPGDGASRVVDCLRLLLDRGFTGVWSIEPHVQFRPHQGKTDLTRDSGTLFVEYGRHLEQLVRTQVLPDPVGAIKEQPGVGTYA